MPESGVECTLAAIPQIARDLVKRFDPINVENRDYDRYGRSGRP